MSDVPDVPETPDVGAAEAAESVVEQQQESRPAPTQEDLDKAYAKVREFEKDAYAHRQLIEDPDAFARFAAEHHGFEIAEDEPEYDDALLDDDPIAEIRARQERIEESERQRQNREIEADLAAHVMELTADTDLDDDEKVQLFELAKGADVRRADRQRTEQLVQKYVERVTARAEARAEARYQEYLESKRAPAPPQEGKAGEPQIDPWDSDARVARLAALMTGEGS